MEQQSFALDLDKYSRLLKAVGSMTRLYSDGNRAFIHSRFVEKLFVNCSSNSRDLSRSDMSFDAVLSNGIGVGVKTFIADNEKTGKSEKIAEFTNHAKLGVFQGLGAEQLAKKASELRNNRIISDANEYSISQDKSIYHCLVRVSGHAFIHEEPYNLVDLNNIKPTDNKGFEISNFSDSSSGHSYFTDGKSKYRYDVAKNVLYKRFELSLYKNSPPIELPIYEDIFDRIIGWVDSASTKPMELISELVAPSVDEVRGKNYVVLPLYSTRTKTEKVVAEKSGINQWNAGGRDRKFGESYIPIPKDIHKYFPGFFPSRDVKFMMLLPNGNIVSAKVCQENSKALMSDPNTELCDWLYNTIDGDDPRKSSRFREQRPFTYEDLVRVGKDSVKIIKVEGRPYQFELHSHHLGAFEEFIAPEDSVSQDIN
jgi:hypothetical protein